MDHMIFVIRFRILLSCFIVHCYISFFFILFLQALIFVFLFMYLVDEIELADFSLLDLITFVQLGPIFGRSCLFHYFY